MGLEKRGEGCGGHQVQRTGEPRATGRDEGPRRQGGARDHRLAELVP